MTHELQDGWLVNLGQAKYLEVLDLQRRLVELRQGNVVPDTLLLVEHEPIITLGRRGSTDNILSSAAELALQGIRIQKAERGGDVTYHGPGQLVCYPIVHLTQRNLSVRRFVDLLEETIIQVLANFGIQASREPQHRGVWVSHLKVAALGVAIRRWVSFHGIALNVSPNMAHFCHINPCELKSEQVTSMAKLLGETPSMEEVIQKVVGRFVEQFPGRWRNISPNEILTEVQMENVNVQAGINPAPTILSK
ncbi:MAG: lipoyl(octanoyl) transferase LipB [Deltaproteobacteria bacterium]|nr:MAG: lipoyl(octanoyl) transferase LipB [Deltaproteobacteria bacterium]